MHALSYGIREHAVDAHSRKQERQSGEGRKQQHVETPRGNRVRYELFHRLDANHRHIGRDLMDRRADIGGSALRISHRTHSQREGKAPERTKALGRVYLRRRPVDCWSRFGCIDAVHLDIAGHTDDFPHIRREERHR